MIYLTVSKNGIYHNVQTKSLSEIIRLLINEGWKILQLRDKRGVTIDVSNII